MTVQHHTLTRPRWEAPPPSNLTGRSVEVFRSWHAGEDNPYVQAVWSCLVNLCAAWDGLSFDLVQACEVPRGARHVSVIYEVTGGIVDVIDIARR